MSTAADDGGVGSAMAGVEAVGGGGVLLSAVPESVTGAVGVVIVWSAFSATATSGTGVGADVAAVLGAVVGAD